MMNRNNLLIEIKWKEKEERKKEEKKRTKIWIIYIKKQ